ncbi:MAG: AAA family ATPase, partial [Promethearchaeota archaeon]
RIVTQLLALMDGLEDRGQVVVIGTTNRLNAIDPALRRGGRFDREIKIGVPSIEGRLEILQIHTRWIPLDDVNLFEIAKKTHGFVGSDLASLVKESVFIAIRKSLPSLNLNERIPFSKLINIKVKQEHFDEALKEIHPSSLREFTIEIPDVNFKHIGGLKKEKKRLKELLEWPLKYPRVCEKLNIHPPKGILLHGPPGCGKTLIAKAIPNEINMNFISVKGSEILSKWLGESEKAISEIFMKARQCAPCIMFFDEIDAIIPEKQGIEDESNTIRRVISQLLTEMDGLEKSKDIVVLAATTDPKLLNPALLRAGRFDILIEIGLPDPFERAEIFDIHMKNRPLADDIDIDYLIEHTEGKSGAYIQALCTEASKNAMRRWIATNESMNENNTERMTVPVDDINITMQDFKLAINYLDSQTLEK